MGVYVSVRGWIEANNEQLTLIRAIIDRDEDEIGHYRDSWCFPTSGGGFSRFVFFGCTVRESAVDRLRSQVRRIAETVKSQDDLYVDYVVGEFLLEHESHESAQDQHPLTRWRFRSGGFTEGLESVA